MANPGSLLTLTSPVDGLRRRGGDAPESDLDSVLDHHKQMQERLADEMVELARNMKDHAQAASNIVKEDNKVRCSCHEAFSDESP